MTSYISLGAGGADTWTTSVATVGDLPATGAAGEVKLVRATGGVYFWNGAAWALVSSGAGSIDIEDLVSFTDGTLAAAGLITERISNSQTTATGSGIGTSGNFGNVLSISVTAGRWVLSGVAGFDDNGATLTTALEAGISNSATGAGLTIADVIKDDTVSGSTVSRSMVVPELFVSLNATTTYYLNTKFTYSAGSPQHYGKLAARRVG